MNKRQTKKQDSFKPYEFRLLHKRCRCCQAVTPHFRAYIELTNEVCSRWISSTSECGCAITNGNNMDCKREKPCGGGTQFTFACTRCERSRDGVKITDWAHPTWPQKKKAGDFQMKKAKNV